MSTDDLPARLRAAQGALRAAKAGLDQAQADLAAACAAVARLAALAEAKVIAALPSSDVPVTAHRRAHRPGRPAQLDADPELRAFVLARIDSLTYQQIADEIALQYPLERRIGKSAIHHWWRRNQRGFTGSGNAGE
ncbi:MAG: hypothetical protein KDA73_01350 [Rhodobacteraceae bacterium]|nr:hypothetical protein [Paracoccaceae bacterium]